MEAITIARPYAKAVFEIAVEQKTFQEWSILLNMLAHVVANSRIKQLLQDPQVTSAAIVAILTEICREIMFDEGRQLLQVLAEEKRLSVLNEIADYYERLVEEHERKIKVKVVSAYSIQKEQQEKLMQALKKRLNRDIILEMEIDKSVLGGAMIYAGDKVFDGSLRGRIKKLSESLRA